MCWSWCWLRVFAFASEFPPEKSRHGDVFGHMRGDSVEGHLAPSSKYGATVLECRIGPTLRIHDIKCDCEPFRRLTLDDYDYDFRTCSARRCPDQWPYFYAPALGCAALLTSRGSPTLASDRSEHTRYDHADVFCCRRNPKPRSKSHRPRAPHSWPFPEPPPIDFHFSS